MKALYFIYLQLVGGLLGILQTGLGAYYRARTLFFRENNGFIAGLVCGTLLFLVLGRAALWATPVLLAAAVMFCTRRFFRASRLQQTTSTDVIEGMA